jgi:RNA methyltransferase, TrmH family
MVRRLKRNGTHFVRVSPEEFRRVSITERASGIAVIFRQPVLKLSDIKPGDSICWTALSDIRSLGNLGTRLRTSAAVGAGGFILIGDKIDPFDPGVIRATMGAFSNKESSARI